VGSFTFSHSRKLKQIWLIILKRAHTLSTGDPSEKSIRETYKLALSFWRQPQHVEWLIRHYGPLQIDPRDLTYDFVVDHMRLFELASGLSVGPVPLGKSRGGGDACIWIVRNFTLRSDHLVSY
jgi:hypothetical protein